MQVADGVKPNRQKPRPAVPRKVPTAKRKDARGPGPYRVPGGALLMLRRYYVSTNRLAEILGLSPTSASQRIHGYQPWTYEDLWKLAEALDVPLKSLV